MAIRIPWSLTESVILLDALIAYLDGKITLKSLKTDVSSFLRKYALYRGIEIDDKFRNENGIAMQLWVMEYYFTGGKHGLKKDQCPKIFQEAIDLYHQDRKEFERILREAKAMNQNDKKEQFFVWLSSKVPASNLSDFYLAYDFIENYAKDSGILKTELISIKTKDELISLSKNLQSSSFFRNVSSRDRFYIGQILIYLEEYSIPYTAPIVKKDPVITNRAKTVITSKPKSITATVSPDQIDFMNLQDYVYTKPYEYIYADETIQVSSWRMLYMSVVKCLLRDHPDKILSLKNGSITRSGAIDICDNKSVYRLRTAGKLGNDLYIEVNLSAKNIAQRIKYLLDMCHVPYSDLVIRLKKNDPNAPKEQIKPEKKKVTAVGSSPVDRPVQTLSNPQTPSSKQPVFRVSAKKTDHKSVDFTIPASYSFTLPIQFVYFGEVYSVKTWKEVYTGVLACLLEDYPNVFIKLKNKPTENSRVPIIFGKTKSSSLRTPALIGNNLYVETNRRTDHFIRCMKIILDLCNVDYENLTIEYVDESNSAEKTFELKYDKDKISSSSFPVSAVYYNRSIPNIESWIDLYVKFMKIIWIERSGKLKDYIEKSFVDAENIDIGNENCISKMTKPIKLSSGVFLETALTNQEVVDRLNQILNIMNIPAKRLRITYVQPKDKKTGDDRITFDNELIHRCRSVILERFNNGIKQELQNESGRPTISGRQFIRAYSEIFGEDFPEDIKIEDVVSSFALLYEGKYYAFSEEAFSFLEKSLKQLMNSHHIFFYSALYNELSSELTGYNIYSANMLCVLIKRIFPDYKYKKNYFSDQRKGLEETLIDLFKLHGTLDFEQISEMMPYVDMSVVRQICSRRIELIRIGEGKYSLTEKIEFDDSDVCCSEKIIQDNIKARKYCLTNSLTVEKSIYLNDDIPVLTLQTVLFDRYFSDKYIRVGRLISAKDESISVDRLLTDYCLEHKHITLEELENFELEITESDKRHSLKIANKYMIRTDTDHFVSKDEIKFDVALIDEKIALFCSRPVISLADINSFNLFPYVEGYSWNSFLLASYIRHFSKKWKLEGIDGRKDVVGAIVDPEIQYEDYDELLMTAVAFSDVELYENEVAGFLVEHGFRMRKTDVSSIISGAYRIREKSE